MSTHLRLSDAHLKELGRVAANFSKLEGIIVVIISAMISPEQDIGRIVCAQLSFDRSLDVLWGLTLHRLGECPDTEELRVLIRRAAEAAETRNRLLHASWFFGLTTTGVPLDKVIRVKQVLRRGRKVSHQIETIRPSDLAGAAMVIDSVTGDLAEFMSRLAQEGKIYLADATPPSKSGPNDRRGSTR